MRIRRTPLWLLAAALLLGASAFPTFTGTRARPQDDATLERGLLRNDLAALRSFRSRAATWLLTTDTAMQWEQHVSRSLVVALASPPDEFATFATSRDPAVSVAGPDLSGGVVRVALPGGRGEAILAVHLPDLLTTSRGLGNLVNAPHPGRGHFRSALHLKSGDTGLRALFVPKSPRPLSRGLPPEVPLFPLPDRGSAAYAVLGDDSAEGAEASALIKTASSWAKGSKLDLAELGPWPKREGSLTESLRSVRVETKALGTPSGVYRTLSMAPGTWTFSDEKVRHPARVLSAALPVAIAGDDASEPRSAVSAVVAYYVPLLLTAEEAPLYLGVEPRAFLGAVHAGELPFFRAGDDVFFLRGHLDRWGERGAREGSGKVLTPAEAVALTKSWGDKYKLRGLARAAGGALPLRFVPVSDADKADLVDARVQAKARVFQDDLSAWLKHFEPGLKQGKQKPVWSFASSATGATLTAALTLPTGPAAEPPGAAETLASSTSSASGPTFSSSGGDGMRVEILDFYPDSDVCLTGGDVTAAVAFDIAGVPVGDTARLRLEWDLSFGGRSVARDAWKVEREAGSHEVEFSLECPTSEGEAELYITLFAPGTEVEAEATTPLFIEAYGGRSWGKLTMPSAKPCKDASFSGGDDGDFGMSTTAGLSSTQILTAVRAFQEQTLRCYRGGVTISGRLTLELTVECDGRVTESLLEDDSTSDADFAQCVADTFKYAPFPAHDREGGAVFQLPLLYE